MPSDFDHQLRLLFTPVMRENNFKGSGRRFRRSIGEVLQAVTIQGSRDGDTCCVELGVHLCFLPTPIGRAPDLAKLTSYDCEFRRRLAPDGRDDAWWGYGTTEAYARESVELLTRTFKQVGLPYLDRFSTFPGAFAAATPTQVVSGDISQLPAPSSRVRLALSLARISRHLGRVDDARAFATAALEQLDCPPMLKHEFERVLAGCESAS